MPVAPDLSIVIPALSEERRIGHTLDALAKYLRTPAMKGVKTEVIVVAADSTDATHQIAGKKTGLFDQFVLLRPGAPVGKGRDVQYGMLRAKGKVVMYMDADLATPLHHIAYAYQQCRDGAPVVIATRNLRNHHKSAFRRFIANGGNMLFRVVSGIWIEDTQCGFKAFRRTAARTCFNKMTIQQWGFDMEILAIAKINGLPITTFRVDDWRDMPYSTFEHKMLGNILRALLDFGHIALRRATGRYHK